MLKLISGPLIWKVRSERGWYGVQLIYCVDATRGCVEDSRETMGGQYIRTFGGQAILARALAGIRGVR